MFQGSMLRRGYLRFGRVKGVELRLHWSVPLGALIFAGVRFEPVSWLAFVVILAWHQLGHVMLARWSRVALAGVDVTAFGGDCRLRGNPTEVQIGCVAWGGVLAQALLLCIALSALAFLSGGAGAEFVSQNFVKGNIWILALNLLPIRGLDGSKAWRLFPALRARGWTPARASYVALRRWAQQRRDERHGVQSRVPPSVQSHVASERAASPSAEVRASSAEDVDDLAAPQPSLEAQRELAALLERITEKAARAKRGR